jgi:3-hydroxybutyryl-CoA dehydratase
MSTLQAGDKALRSLTITDETIRAFAEVTGDTNPVHLDDNFAAGTRFGRRIAHGMIAAGLISAALANDLPGPGTVYLNQTLKFKLPVYPGDTVTATVEVTNQDDKVVLEGEAVVLFEG